MAGDVLNVEQAEEWNGDHGGHWVDQQQRYDLMLAPFAGRLLDAAALDTTEAVLDVGCGTGATTRAAALVAGDALGADVSEPMLAHARGLAAAGGLKNVGFVQADVQVHPFELESFDVAMSRFGVMFFADPVAAFTNIAGALRRGGRLVFTCWRSLPENEWLMAPAGAALEHVPLPDFGEEGRPGPFSLADADRVDEVLKLAGFDDVVLEPLDEPLRVGSDAEDAAEFMRGTGLGKELLGSVSPDVAERAIGAVREVLGQFETADGVKLGSAAWLVSARATGTSTTGAS